MPTAPAEKLIRTCSIWRALEVVGDTAILLILEAIWLGDDRFDRIRERTGLLKALLSDRLKRLIAADILKKEPLRGSKNRFRYRMTRKGVDLYWTALMMLRWELRWSDPRGKIELVLRHSVCGKTFEPVPSCRVCGDEVSARDVSWEQGPGVGWMAAQYSRRRQTRGAAEQRTAHTALLDEAAQITGDRWIGLILRSIFTRLRKFDEIRKDTGIATNILSDRLAWLEERGVITPSAYSDNPLRYQYFLTEKGVDYYPILLMLLRWGDAYYVSPEGPPLLLRHKKDGHPLDAQVTCSECGGVIDGREVTYEVRPARGLERPKRSAA